ncbi:hypothetical protein QWY85_04315 [Neolewinella lacunae]|uniref:DUF1997 domain-containing protein n=1 Tax=Neolewinella lacunae TaxID=1517758 RepID=A0A923PMI5_9BACT|nr:hypothetical protein [Neolewinella lacunae]MBC6996750.1 hypothetical protein [Neolewinella lacunae]MDN3633870.1 hypothetical protein [Neolewinella lacunae]
MSASPAPLQALLEKPTVHLAGTDATLRLHLSRNLLNEILAARPPDTPVQELLLDPDDGQAHLHLEVQVPVLGTVHRRITLRPGPAVCFPDQPWLEFVITDGFKLFDKPILKLMQGQIDERLPRGIELSAEHLRLHIPALLTAAGYQPLVPLLHRLEIQSVSNQLILTLHLVA